MNILYDIIVFAHLTKIIVAYSNNLYLLVSQRQDEDPDETCYDPYQKQRLHGNGNSSWRNSLTFETTTTRPSEDPFLSLENIKQKVVFGSNQKGTEDDINDQLPLRLTPPTPDGSVDRLAHFPSGRLMHAELFQNKSSVHMSMAEFIHRGHCLLNITDDYMQTAIDAFTILLQGTLADVLKLPPAYVLRSARTIAMMKIEKEKLRAMWTVVKGNRKTKQIPYHELELFRPLFKHLSGREIARLNMSDDRILVYIGTHADLDRHQVGVTASKYISQNRDWAEPPYMNLMNNLLCGVPLSLMRKIPEGHYLLLTPQLFHHIRACDPLQRRFYLTMMTKTQALGKSYSWSTQDVARLGLLLTEVSAAELAAVSPGAMAGITAQVMIEMPARNLLHITETQLRHLGQKPMNILANKLRKYSSEYQINSMAEELQPKDYLTMFVILGTSWVIL
ncbi:unnamed protein product [Chilo suppressalis]|uniref:SAM domain-containing protein n=1 Tax=Chilo suppressalis TaxID=168631 RepID=A0ABN8B8U6_CHISP|nr:unnamed protein product [Chilo suppressalis]